MDTEPDSQSKSQPQPEAGGKKKWSPTPLDENTNKSALWTPEEWDKNLPPVGGFIRDFVYATRGMETPSSFSCWSAIFLISSIIRRDAWLAWYPKPMFPNIFAVMVAPPRICGKTTVSNFASKILRDFDKEIENPLLRTLKKPRVIQNKATPEALIKAMVPTTTNVIVGTNVKTVDSGSQVAIIVPELETFMGKQKYNEGLLGLLTDIYDCHDFWEYRSITHDVQELRDMYVTFFGGTTPQALESTISDAAFGGGFMSRMVLVYEPRSTRSFPRPFLVPGAPDIRELSKRLAWIAQNHRGEYNLSPEADALYKDWYHPFKKDLEDGSVRNMLFYRLDNTLLKLALLIRANKYEPGNVIEATDFNEALQLINATYEKSWKILDNVGATEYHRHLRLGERRLQSKGTQTRREMLTNIRWTNSAECTQAMNQLYQEGKIKISVGNLAKHMATTESKEIYTWVGEPLSPVGGISGGTSNTESG